MRCRLATLLSLLCLQGCLSSGERIDRQAAAAGLRREIVAGSPFQHVVYSNRADSATAQGRLVIFIEGDGRPWRTDGKQPSDDPTTRRPIALSLLRQTSLPALYVSRPCYQQIADPECSSSAWTDARYSTAVVQSIAAVVERQASARGAATLTLIGYSGGGTLAILVAEQLVGVDAVITLAANLDTAAWTQHHRYLPLTNSLNPALSERAHPWREIHLQGSRDPVVPPATTAAYFQRYPGARRLTFDYDHVCCWVRDWPRISAQAQAAMAASTDQGAD